jgi:hypothetical protein
MAHQWTSDSLYRLQPGYMGRHRGTDWNTWSGLSESPMTLRVASITRMISMTKWEAYRAEADECRRMATKALDPVDREMAEGRFAVARTNSEPLNGCERSQSIDNAGAPRKAARLFGQLDVCHSRHAHLLNNRVGRPRTTSSDHEPCSIVSCRKAA